MDRKEKKKEIFETEKKDDFTYFIWDQISSEEQNI